MQALNYPAARPFFEAEDIIEIQQKVGEILASGRLILGENTRQFEDQFSRYVGVNHSVAVNSCTSALQIALRYYSVRGKRVIVPTNNFVGGIAAILYEGGIPVLADMDANTFNIDINDVIEKIDDNTVGVILVHIAGLITPDFERLKAICSDNELFLIEDAAHASGATFNGKQAGSLADVGCFSFYPTKILTTCTGGMITTNNPDLELYARQVRHHGFSADSQSFDHLGNDWCMSELLAVLGSKQLARLEENITHRNHIADCYRRELVKFDWLTVPSYPANVRHAYYKFPVLLDNRVNRDEFRTIMKSRHGIEMGAIYYPPCHLQPVLKSELKIEPGSLPVSEAVLSRQICPPMHASIKEKDIAVIAAAMDETACSLI